MWNEAGFGISPSRCRIIALTAGLALASPAAALPGCSSAGGEAPFAHTLPKRDPAWLKPGVERGPVWRESQRVFLASIDANPDWKRTATGLRFRREGPAAPGVRPAPASWVRVCYVGRLADGTEFHRSPGDMPIEAPLSGVIPGWREAVPMMRVGESWRFVIPPDLGYGETGRGPIPGGAILVFEITLAAVETPAHD